MHSKVYYALELARVTTGYDPSSGKTQLRCWRLAVTGPFDLTEHGITDALKAEVEAVVRKSAETALWEAYTVAMATPGEVSVKLAAAWQVFWQRFPLLLQQNADAAAAAIIDAFTICLLETALEEDGLILVVKTGEDPVAALYEKAYDWVADQLGGDAGNAANMAVDLYRQYTRSLAVDIDIRAPKAVNDALVEAAKLGQSLKDMPQRLADLADQVRNAPDQLGKGLSTAVLRLGEVSEAIYLQLKGVGLKFDLGDGGEERLRSLVAGVPRLDWSPDGFGAELKNLGAQAYEKAAREMQAQAQRLVDGMRSLASDIAAAAQRGAVELVSQLQGKLSELARQREQLGVQMQGISNILGASDLALPNDVLDGMTQTGEAAKEVAQEVAVATQQAIDQAAKIAQGLLDSAGNAIQQAGDWLRDRLGL